MILVKARFARISGGYRRLYEVLKRGKAEGINYVIITDVASYANYTKMFSDFPKICRQYKTYFVDSQKIRLKLSLGSFIQISFFKEIFLLSLAIARIARREDADLIVYPGEGTSDVVASYLASLLCSRPWSAIFQPGAVLNQPNLFEPSYSLNSITPLNVLTHVNRKTKESKLSRRNRFGLGIAFFFLLKLAEKTVILTVSTSVVEDFHYLNPRIRLLPIIPGNGVDMSRFVIKPPKHFSYQGVFFARMIPEKGFFDLVDIWKLVVERLPNAKLAVCGISADSEVFKTFFKKVKAQNLKKNVEFLGQLHRLQLIKTVANSYLTVNPSYVEAFSLTTLESLACGTPVVAYDLPAIKHNFGKCKSVFRCPIGNKKHMADMIICVLTKMNRTTLAEEAKKLAIFYDWKNVVRAEKHGYEIVTKSKLKTTSYIEHYSS